MANGLQTALKKLAAAHNERIEAAQKKVEAAEKFRNDGWLPAGKNNRHNGETPVLATWEDSTDVEEYVEPSVFLATVLAEDIERIDGGNAMIRRYDTRIDEDGEEFFITEKKSIYKSFELPCKKSFYTDSSGIILPPAQVLAHLGVYVEPVDVCEDDGEEEFPKASIRPEPVGPYIRKWAYDCFISPSQGRFERLLSQPRKAIDRHVVLAVSAAVNMAKADKKRAKADAIVHARKDAPEVDIATPAPVRERPTKVMTWKDRLASARRRKASEKKVCPERVAKISAHEKELVCLQKRLSAQTAEIKEIRHSWHGLVQGPKRTQFREEVLPRKLDQASDTRMEIVWIKEIIVSLKEGI